MYLSTELSTGDVDKKYASQNLHKRVKKKEYFFEFFKIKKISIKSKLKSSYPNNISLSDRGVCFKFCYEEVAVIVCCFFSTTCFGEWKIFVKF